jgi:hypothetical protein
MRMIKTAKVRVRFLRFEGLPAAGTQPVKSFTGPFPVSTPEQTAYMSAHIEGVESERVVRSGHSCQSHPVTIEEVRRILLEHLRQLDPAPFLPLKRP